MEAFPIGGRYAEVVGSVGIVKIDLDPRELFGVDFSMGANADKVIFFVVSIADEVATGEVFMNEAVIKRGKRGVVLMAFVVVGSFIGKGEGGFVVFGVNA